MNYVEKEVFDELVKRVEKLEGSEASAEQRIKKSLTVREFLHAKKPKGAPNVAIHLMYFHEIIKQNDEGVTSPELRKLFEYAREKTPGNLSDVLSKCARRALVSEKSSAGQTKVWQLTSIGIEYVEKVNDN